MDKATLGQLLATEAGQRIATVTRISDGTQALYNGGQPPAFLSASQSERLQRIFRAGHSTAIEDEDGLLFVQVFSPPLRLAIVGAVHISQALAPIAAACGYEVTIIDPRTSFASPERFAGITLDTRWPDTALAEFAPDAATAIVTLTHDAKLDDPALRVALRSDAFYIGALGSTRTQAKRRERLTEAGFEPVQMQRIHGPVGLNIGARSPQEIAVAIMAQITQVHRGAPST